MKMLALITDAFGGDGGIACYNRDLMAALSNHDSAADILILPRDGKPSLLPKGIRQLTPRNNKIVYSLFAFWHCLKFRPRTIFCGHLFLLPLAVLLARIFRIKVWLQLHGIEAWQPLSGKSEKYWRNVESVTCVSRYTRRRFLAWADIDGDKVHVLPNTVSDSFLPQDRDVARKEFDIERNKVILLTVSRLASAERYKGHDLVLQMLPRLLQNNPDVMYLVAGEGDDRQRLESMAQDLGIQHAVRFLGKVPNENLPALYTAADLFLMPSTGEGFGIVFLEAMACGTPALGLNVDGSTDPLRDGEMGFICDADHLVEEIEKALSFGRSESLSERVHAVFGKSSFDRQVVVLQKKIIADEARIGASPCAV